MNKTPLGLGLIGAGHLVGALSGAAAARRQNGLLTQGSRQQNRAGMESASVLGNAVSQLRGSQPRPQDEAGMFADALGGGSVNALPTASARFRGDAARATGGARGYGQNLASLFARIRAPQRQRTGEAEMLVDAGNALRPIQRRAEDDAYLTNLRASMVQPNPWLGLLGKGMADAGSFLVGEG